MTPILCLLASVVAADPAGQETEVLVLYSPSAIHFGVRASAEKGSVRASLAQRDKLDAARLRVEYQATRAIDFFLKLSYLFRL